MRLTLLQPGDEAELERFLVARADSSMFLRSNSASSGLVDRGEPRQATYVAARNDAGEIVAVAAHGWNGMILVQGELASVGDATRDAVARSGRGIKGFSGPYAQVVVARAALGLTDRTANLDEKEDLFVLDLSALCVPAALVDGRVAYRSPSDVDRPLLARWAYEYEIETLGTPPSEERAAHRARTYELAPSHRVLVVDDAVVAMTRFNAELPDMVQVGGVYTPRELRGFGYARAVVAGSLLDARARGVTRSILFTANAAARTAYLSLGYRIVDSYGLVLFDAI